MPACSQIDVSRACATIRGRYVPRFPEPVVDTHTHNWMKTIAEWRLGLKKAAQAWMDNDDYIRDLTDASEYIMANRKQYLRPRDLTTKTTFRSLMADSLMPALIQSMKEDMKPEMDFLIVSAISLAYSEGSDVPRIASDLNKAMRECAVTHIITTFKLAPWELPGSMQKQLESELKEARCEEIRDVQSKLVYLRGVMNRLSIRSQSNETAQESDSGSMSSWDLSEAVDA